MFLTISNLGARTSFLVRAPLTVPVLHAVAGAFVVHEDYTQFQEALQQAFSKQDLSSYCVDHMPGGCALITFSRLASPLVYTYKNKPARIRAPDVSDFALFVQEVQLSKTPSLFTSDRKGFMS